MKLPLSNITGLYILNIQYSARNQKYMHYTTMGLKKREKGTKPQAKTAVSYNKRPVCKNLLQGNTFFFFLTNTQYRGDFILCFYFIYIWLAWEGIKTVEWNKGTPQGQRHLIGSRVVKQATEELPTLEKVLQTGVWYIQRHWTYIVSQGFCSGTKLSFSSKKRN